MIDMRSVVTRRSLDEIIGDITAVLRPLKHGAGEPRAAISGIVATMEALRQQSGTHTPAIKAKAKIALEKVWIVWKELHPSFVEFDPHRIERAFVAALAGSPTTVLAPGYSRSTLNFLRRLCVLFALSLIATFSKEKPPVSSDAGNVHRIAQLLFEAVTGRPGSNTEFAPDGQGDLRHGQ